MGRKKAAPCGGWVCRGCSSVSLQRRGIAATATNAENRTRQAELQAPHQHDADEVHTAVRQPRVLARACGTVGRMGW